MGQLQRERPKHLAAKLLAIRTQKLKVSQSIMAKLVDQNITGARVSEYEHNVREPNLLVLLGYAKAANVHMEDLVDDALKLPK